MSSMTATRITRADRLLAIQKRQAGHSIRRALKKTVPIAPSLFVATANPATRDILLSMGWTLIGTPTETIYSRGSIWQLTRPIADARLDMDTLLA